MVKTKHNNEVSVGDKVKGIRNPIYETRLLVGYWIVSNDV